MTERQHKAAILGKLALHYWRPDFTAEQAKLVMGDYLNDLEKYSPADVAAACEAYRKKPDSEFFPKIGQLLGILNPPRAAWDIPERKLPTFRSPPLLTGPKPVFASVSDILRRNGHDKAADDWEMRRTIDRVKDKRRA